MAERLADDYAEIAQRMRELAAERGDMQTATEDALCKPVCTTCYNDGWVATDRTTSGWTRCPACDTGYNKPRPPARRR
jgi:hypothetical protein